MRFLFIAITRLNLRATNMKKSATSSLVNMNKFNTLNSNFQLNVRNNLTFHF